MSHFTGMRLTAAGADLLRMVHEGQQLKLLGIQVGCGIWSDEERTNPVKPAALKNVKRSVAIKEFEQHDGAVVLKSLLTNAGMETGFMMTELGVTAEHPVTGELLYMADYLPPEMASFLPPDSTAPVEVPLRIEVNAGTGADVVIRIDDRFVSASKKELETALQKHSDAADPHPTMRVAAPHLAIPNGMVNRVHEGEKLGMTVSGVPENPMWETEVKFQIVDAEGNDVTEQFSAEIADKSVTITAAQVTGDTDFKARFQTWQHGGLASLWSNEFAFTVIDVPVDSPAFTNPANHATGLGETPTFTITPGSSDDDTKQHVHTRFMITRDLLRTVVVKDSGELGAVTNWQPPANILKTNEHLYGHACTQWGDTWSGWTSIDFFTTDKFQFIQPPEIIAPQQGSEVMWSGLKAVITPSVVEQGGTLQQDKIEAKYSVNGVEQSVITVNSAQTYVDIPTLARNADIDLQVRTHDTVRGWSEWSAVRAFRTKNVAHGMRVDGGIAVGNDDGTPISYPDGTQGYTVFAPGSQRKKRGWGLHGLDTSLSNIPDWETKDTNTSGKNTAVLCSLVYRDYVDSRGYTGSPAATYCYDIIFEGCWDFALPNKEDLALCMQHQNLIDSLDESLDGKFSQMDGQYLWSSSELNSGYVWRQRIGDDRPSIEAKYGSNWVVPCRRVITG